MSARRRVVLLGHDISYSASPTMQGAAFAAAGLDWRYELLDVPPEQLRHAVERLRDPCYIGANVTIPHKTAVMALIDRVDGEAREARAVNTIERDGEALLGTNTDVIGIRAAVGAVGVEPGGAVAVVLGAGGSARAAGVALRGARLTFVARRPEAAAGLPGEVLSWETPEWRARVRHADLLLNATPVGRRGDMPLRPGYLPPRGAVIDLVYVNGGTPLTRRARQLGLRCVDGWSILLAQGAASFERWTGRPAPLEIMRGALPGSQ